MNGDLSPAQEQLLQDIGQRGRLMDMHNDHPRFVIDGIRSKSVRPAVALNLIERGFLYRVNTTVKADVYAVAQLKFDFGSGTAK